jgi:hypothetical protein
MAGDDVLSDELIDDEIKTLDRWARIYPNLRGSANAMIDLVRNLRLAQQRERERLIARAWAPIRHPDECNVDLGECDCGNTESIAAMEARHEAEVRELRAALRTAEQQRDHWRRECSDIQERAALSTKAGG